MVCGGDARTSTVTLPADSSSPSGARRPPGQRTGPRRARRAVDNHLPGAHDAAAFCRLRSFPHSPRTRLHRRCRQRRRQCRPPMTVFMVSSIRTLARPATPNGMCGPPGSRGARGRPAESQRTRSAWKILPSSEFRGTSDFSSRNSILNCKYSRSSYGGALKSSVCLRTQASRSTDGLLERGSDEAAVATSRFCDGGLLHSRAARGRPGGHPGVSGGGPDFDPDDKRSSTRG